MKITVDKKYYIIENQFDKLPSEIIDYIYFFVNNNEPSKEHKNFIKNDLLLFININKKLNKGFKNIRFLLNNTIILNNRTKCDYQRIKDVKDFNNCIKESFNNNVILTSYEYGFCDVFLIDFLEKNIFSFCKTIKNFETILKQNYYYKDNEEILKKTTLKKLNKLIKEKNNKLIFEMIEFYKLIKYLCNYKTFKEKNFLDVYDCSLICDEYVLFTNYYY